MQLTKNNTQQFKADQRIAVQVEYWDTPYTALDNGVASAGVPMNVRQPLDTGTWTLPSIFKSAADNTDLSGTGTNAFNNDTYSKACLRDSAGTRVEGVTDNLIGYWAAGAPGHHGASWNGRVAYHFRLKLRPVNGRSWWSTTATPSFFLALAGSGWMRIDRKVGSTVTTIFKGNLSETRFLDEDGGYEVTNASGYASSSKTSLAISSSDQLDVYYIQDAGDPWGGFVIKAVLGDLSTMSQTQINAAAAAAPVAGCGLFDGGVQPTKRTFIGVRSIETDRSVGATSQAQVELPLLSPQKHDGAGWELYRDPTDKDDPGVLRLWDAGAVQFSVRRGMLVRISTGFMTPSASELYPVFTGLVEDFPASNGVAQLSAKDFQSVITTQTPRNYPDKVSYMAAGYRSSTSASEPVYEIPAFDGWSMESAVEELLVRSGIDASNLTQKLTVPTANGTSTGADTPVKMGGEDYFKFRARRLSGQPLMLERQVRYGNAKRAFEEGKAPDDSYLFKPEVSRDTWQQAREITDRYGYDLAFDETGAVVMGPRNNPHRAYDYLTTGHTLTGTIQLNPGAYKGFYVNYPIGTQTAMAVSGARIDLVYPRGVGFGRLQCFVHKASDNSVVVGPIQIDPSLPAGSATQTFYDARATSDGSNPCVSTLFSGDYGDYVVRIYDLDSLGFSLDCVLAYHTDPATPRLASPLSTSVNALSVNAKSSAADQRNFVIVVGKRKGAVSDSAKLDNNPENPEGEFNVAVAVDNHSVANPAAKNFVGRRKDSVIYDTKVSDGDFASYLSRYFVYRQRSPKPNADVEHTLLPVVQLRDPVYAVEDRYKTVTSQFVVYVTGVRHRIEFGDQMRATTMLATTSYPEYAAYEPREDVDLALFNNNAVTNVGVKYTSLMNTAQVNPPKNAVAPAAGDEVTYNAQTVTTASGFRYIQLPATAPWPPQPGTLFIRPVKTAAAGVTVTKTFTTKDFILNGFVCQLENVQSVTSVVAEEWTFGAKAGTKALDPYTIDFEKDQVSVTSKRPPAGMPMPYTTVSSANRETRVIVTYVQGQRHSAADWLTNTPTHHFHEVDYRDSARRIYLPWNEGDGSSSYAFNSAVSGWDVRYRKLCATNPTTGAVVDPYAGGSPFYDVTSAELGYLVTVSMDVLKSAYHRVTVRSAFDDTIVAYLTEPSGDSDDADAHWEYVPASVGRAWTWDGTDMVGDWNRRQSQQYSEALMGAFEQGEKPVIGKGWAVWNNETTGGNPGDQAVIAALRDATTGKPVFGVGTYGQWYVCVETKTDSQSAPKRASTNGKTTGITETYVYTHLPEPLKVSMSVSDWVGSDYSEAIRNVTANWGAASSLAHVHNYKPLRVRFTVQPRPGPLWAGKEGQARLKLTRLAHLKALIFDQFMTWTGSQFPGTSTDDRTMYTRRLMDDANTFSFNDSDFRRGSTLKTSDTGTGLDWVFRPQDCKKNWRGVENESIQFGDYLQLTEVPRWDNSKTLGGGRSRLQIAFLGYLFYLSAHAQDCSGRMTWCLDTSFLDKAKILKSATTDFTVPVNPGTNNAALVPYALQWPEDPHLMQRRSIVVRQWTDEGQTGSKWVAQQKTRWGIGTGKVGEWLLQHFWKDHDPATSSVTFPMTGTTATWASFSLGTDWHSHRHTQLSGTEADPKLPSSFANMNRQISNGSNHLGTSWYFEGNPLWEPCITRDFHGYWLVPPMFDAGNNGTQLARNYYLSNYCYTWTDGRKYDGDGSNNNYDDAAAAQVWTSPAFDMTEVYANGKVRFYPGHKLEQRKRPLSSSNDQVPLNAFNYGRQDEMQHYEDFRGAFSRGQRPAEAPKKVAPVSPYYVNPYRYTSVYYDWARKNAPYPNYRVDVGSWFSLTFRRQYVWESARMFPTDQWGREKLVAYNAARTRYLGESELRGVRYDGGGYVGWKDDKVLTLQVESDPAYALTATNTTPSVFDSRHQPIAVGPRLISNTTDVVMHLVLVNERREAPL